MSDDNLTVSLEPHLAQTLRRIQPILPIELAQTLALHLPAATSDADSRSSTPTTRSVPYSTLTSISRWTRTNEGSEALAAHTPKLDSADYSMISLLAGVRTSPEKHFPLPPQGQMDPALARKRELNDRHVIANIANALLSVFGCGAATWYAAGAAGWRNEWRVLCGLLAGAIVAIAEAVLYIIYTTPPKRLSVSIRSRVQSAQQKKTEPPEQTSPSDDIIGRTESDNQGLRQRAKVVTSEQI